MRYLWSEIKGFRKTPVTPSYDGFYVQDISGSDNTLSIKKTNNSAYTLSIEKSTDGVNWSSMGSTSTTAITATIPANGKLYLRCKTSQSWGRVYNYNSYCNIISASGIHNVGGNIMSLLYGEDYTGEERVLNKVYIFFSLFYGDTKLVSAENLVLPATTLTENCYASMFSGCSALTTAPALPATTLVKQCYWEMFKNCTSLTAIPELSSTTLAEYCYGYMFDGCSSLAVEPYLPAPILVTGCYTYMFRNCTSLNRVYCMATDNSATGCTSNWLEGVASTGLFTIPQGSQYIWSNSGGSSVPGNWLIVYRNEG